MTAVEWFFENLNSHKIEANANELFQQALEMEKQQIKNAWLNGHKSNMIQPLDDIKYQLDFEEYYNETYKPSA